jgi:hypothetical protein
VAYSRSAWLQGDNMPDPLKMIRAAHEAKEHFDEMLLRANVQDSGEVQEGTKC